MRLIIVVARSEAASGMSRSGFVVCMLQAETSIAKTPFGPRTLASITVVTEQCRGLTHCAVHSEQIVQSQCIGLAPCPWTKKAKARVSTEL